MVFGDIMVMVPIRETYDLSTKPDKMGMIGVHTPSMDVISRSWSGLVQNHKLFRPHHCNITIACASTLPADPLQVGLAETGQIAPQDMFNPILYTAVSNDSFGTIQTRMYSLGYFNGTQSASVDYDQDPIPDAVDNWGVYYSMLSSDGFRKAMPQSGLRMTGLRPLVHTVYENIATSRLTGISDNNRLATWDKSSGDEHATAVNAATLKGRPVTLPFIPTMYWVTSEQNTEQFGSTTKAVPATIPATFVALILMPPSKLSVLYYRMTIEWWIEFTDLRDNMQVSSLSNLEYEGLNRFYYTDYAEQSKDLHKENMVDTSDMDIKQIM